MAVYVVGDFLRETRLRKGYTQEEVSYGICTPASLSRIENGAQKPGRLILEKLFERLGTCRLPRLLTQQGLTTIERVNNAG